MEFFNRLQSLIDFEAELLSLNEISNSTWASYEIRKIADIFYANASFGMWLDYFEGLLPEDGYLLWRGAEKGQSAKRTTRVRFRRVSYFSQLSSLVEKYPIDLMVDYAYWRAARSYLEYFLDTPQYYKGKNTTFASIDRQCIDYVLQYASAAAARLYFDSYGSNVIDWKYDVELVAQAVSSAFRYTIYNADWLDLQDKMAIMNKLKLISIDSGIPDWLLNDTIVEERTPPFDPERTTFENDLLMFREKFLWTMQTLWRNETDKLSEGGESTDAEPNFVPYAQYSEQRIEIWLGALLPPLYNYSYPLALKFGAIGAIIGENLMRAFDPDEIRESFGMRKLVKPEAITAYRIRKSCVALTQPYFRRCIEKPTENKDDCSKFNMRLNAFTADTEGLKLAYTAYAFMAQTVGREPSLPGLLDYDADQLFFLSYARLLCGVPQQLEVALSTFPAFGNAFNCERGSRFAPNFKCTLWSNVSDASIGKRTDD